MNASQFTGNDDRDTLAPDYERDACQDCGADANQPCAPTCGCAHCRRREWAKQDAERGGQDAA